MRDKARLMVSLSFMVGCGLHPLWAANVLWDCFDFDGTAATMTAEGEYYLAWKMPGTNPYNGYIQYADTGFTVSRSGTKTTLTDHVHVVSSVVYWTQIAYGVVVDQFLFDNATSLFSDPSQLVTGESSSRMDSIAVNGNQDIYLAFASYWARPDSSTASGYNFDLGNPYFGWVALNVNQGEVSLLGSYVDLDHNSVIAGRYESSTPEPATALLLLVGGALLALRRRVLV